MNLLVTGGCGFIGSNLINKLIDEPSIDKLVNVDCLTYAGNHDNVYKCHRNPKYFFERFNICSVEKMTQLIRAHGITHVIHLAAESHVDRSINDASNFITTNFQGTYSMLEACRSFWGNNTTGKKFVHVSTDEVFGALGADGLFNEQSPYAPNSPYSASKAASDMIARSYFHTHNLPVVITNCSNNYGPYQYPEKLIPLTISKILAQKPIPVYGKGINVRDWLHVSDHVDALWLALTSGLPGESYCIGSNNEHSNINIVNLICELVDLKLNITDSNSLIDFVEDRKGHDFRYAIDSAKIQSCLNWTPKKTFIIGLRETVEWYLDRPTWFNSK